MQNVSFASAKATNNIPLGELGIGIVDRTNGPSHVYSRLIGPTYVVSESIHNPLPVPRHVKQ